MLIRTRREGATLVVILNDPDRRNALSPDMRAQMIAALDPAVGAGDLRAVVVTGQGHHFCAGGDLRTMPTGDLIAARARMGVAARLVRLLAAGPVPVIAAVEGAAYGAGLSLAALSDRLVAARDARFGAVFGKVGLMADLGLTWSLPNRIGPARARRFLLEETVVTAEAAPDGLVDDLCAPGQALSHALDIAATFDRRAPLPVALTRAAFAQTTGLDHALALEAELQGVLMASDDHAEGRAAFFDRRTPEFRGR